MVDADRALAETIGRFGLDAVTSQPNLCRNTLRDKLPGRTREVALIVSALEVGVPTRLVTESRISDVDMVAAQLAKGLEQSHGLSPENARWAVQTWAKALELSATVQAAAREPTAGSSLDAGTILREPSAPVNTHAATEPKTTVRPSADTTAPVTGAGIGAVTGPVIGGGEGTVLRDAPQPGMQSGTRSGALPPSDATTESTTQAATDTTSRRRRYRLAFAAAAVVLIAAIVGVVLATTGGSARKPTKPAAHGTTSAPASSSSKSLPAKHAATASNAFVAIPPVIAHTGDAESYAPETIAAFVSAAQQGFTAESDVRWTRDGVPIMAHDANTRQTTGLVCSGGPYEVATTSWAVLRSHCQFAPSASPKTHRSYGMPTFAATVEQLSKIPHATLFAELKTDQTTAQNKEYLAILRKWHMVTRTVVTSYFTPYLAHITQAAQSEHLRIRTLRFAKDSYPTTVRDLQHARVWGVCPVVEWSATAQLVKAARRAGLHVGIDTSSPGNDTTSEWAKAARVGVDFVLTTRPSAYHAWLAKN